MTLMLAAGLTGCATAGAPAPQAPGAGQGPAASASVAPSAAEKADAFVVHISDTRRGPVRLAPLRPCTDTSAPSAGCGEITALSPDGSTWQVRRRRSRGATTPGAVWEEAYRIREDLGVARVEPAFEFDQGEWGIEDGPRARGGRSRPDKCGARRDPEWSLKYIHVPQAWAALRRDRGRPDGEEGARVVVAHLDTGYRKHPELWSADPTVSRLLVADGYDFVGKDDDALDELDTGGLVPNPGHGTKSGSVIASPKGKQWSGDCAAVGPDCDGAALSADNCYVSGVAPGARLIPLRVHRSVVHFVPTEMARAIYAASGPDRSLVKKQAGAISISMGGSPSWALWKAVRYARDQGVIVVAAAGNEVGFVVWPARFKETIAVAASNVDCAMWDGSSRGDAVDITAPGESVWRADAAPDDSVGMGQGTTFATATTAGLAALWLDYHDGDPEIARLKAAGLLTEGFRRALQASSWTPAHPPSGVTCARTDWDSRRQGPGIANAEGLLAFDLRTFPGGPMAPSRGGPETLDELPLFASLFADGAAPAEVRLRYGRLLGLSAPEGLQTETAQLEGEILDHYAHDARVRAALDTLAGAPPPSEEAYQGARAALLARDLSPTLRRALAQRGPQP